MDAIDVALFSDRKYLPMLETQDAEIASTPIEQLEESYQTTSYPESTYLIEEEDFDPTDIVDQDAYETMEAIEDDSEGEIIDYVMDGGM
jgi:hypothetical protein